MTIMLHNVMSKYIYYNGIDWTTLWSDLHNITFMSIHIGHAAVFLIVE